MKPCYVKDGELFTTKTMCNLVETWQHECRVYPDEMPLDEAWLAEMRQRARDAFAGTVSTIPWDEFVRRVGL